MLLQLGKLDLLSFFLDLLRLVQFDRIPVIKTVVLSIRIDVITALGPVLTVVINLEVATITFFTIHLDESFFRTRMVFKENVGEAL